MYTTDKTLKKRLYALAIGLSIVIMTGAWVYYSELRQAIQRQTHEELQVLTNLKADQLNRWHSERLSEVAFFSTHQGITDNLIAYLNDEIAEFPTDETTDRLTHIKASHGYFNILIAFPDGEVIYSYEKDFDWIDPYVLEYFPQVIENKDQRIVNFYYCQFHGRLLYDFLAPMINKNGEVIAILIMRIDPDEFLFPFIQAWPIPSETAETILITLEGDSVVLVNELRHLKWQATKMKMHISQQDNVAVKAALTDEGILEGIDYRGKRVLGYSIPLRERKWVMYSKVDRREVFADLNYRTYMVIAFTVAVLLLLWAIMAWIYGGRQKATFRQLYLKEKELLQAEKEFKIALYSIGEGVVTTDKKGRIRKMNFMASQLSGFKEYQAAGHPFDNVFNLFDENTGKNLDNPALTIAQMGNIEEPVIQCLLKKRDGKKIYVAISGAPIIDDKEQLGGAVMVIHDRSSERDAEIRLKESEEKYRTLVEVSTDAIVMIQDNKLVYANPSAIKLVMADNQEQLLGQSPFGFFFPDDQTIIKERIRLMLSTGTPARKIEIKLKRLDGTFVDVEMGSVPFIFNKKKVIQTVISDISERKKAQEALQFSEEKYRTLFETMAQGVVYQDEKGVIVSANPAAERILGLSEEEMSGRYSLDPRWKSISEDGTELPGELHPSMIALKTGRKVFNFIMAVNNPRTGSFTWMNINSIPIFKPGKIVPEGVYSTLEDITRQKEDEKALRESRERYRMLFESNPHPMWVFDLESLAFLDVNQAAITKYGYSRNEFLKMNLNDILQVEEVPRLKESIEASNKGFHFPSEWVHKLKDNTEIFVETSSQPIQYMGKNARLVLINDITQQKQNLQLREEILLARQAAMLKQKFLATMSHEIRTPLTGIIGMTEVLKETSVNPKQQDYIETIRSSSEHLMSVVNNVLDLSKIEAGKMNTRPRVFRFSLLLEKANKLYDSLQKKDTEFSIIADDKIPEHLSGDEQKIFQVITNLLGNAVKFTKKGEITLCATAEEITKKNNAVIKIEIRDTGIGISPENQKKMFQLFSQAENTEFQNYPGTGLGLAISRELVHLLGGEIGVESTPGKGSTFWFTFNAEIIEKPEDIPETPDEQKPETQSMNFLLVEDNQVIRKVIKLILEDMGHQVTQAENGLQAIELYAPDKYDIILMDIQMPVLDGMTAVQRLRKTYRNLPLIVGLSANAMEADAQRYIEKGMDDYITKPVKPADFEKLIDKWF